MAKKSAKKTSKKSATVEKEKPVLKNVKAVFLEVPISKINVLKGFNPRDTLGSLKDLTESIKANGLIENLVVWIGKDEKGEELYNLICGHRRLEAAKSAGLKKVPITIRTDVKDANQALMVAIAENSSDTRYNFTPLEEAKAYLRLRDEGYNIRDIAMYCGTSSAKVQRHLKLFELPDSIKDRLREGKITGNAALVFTTLDDDEKKIIIQNADNIVTKPQIEEMLSIHRRKAGAITSRDGQSKKGKHIKGTFRGTRDVKMGTISLYDVYINSNKSKQKSLAWALAALLWVQGEISAIDPELDEFQDALELVDIDASKMRDVDEEVEEDEVGEGEEDEVEEDEVGEGEEDEVEEDEEEKVEVEEDDEDDEDEYYEDEE